MRFHDLSDNEESQAEARTFAAFRRLQTSSQGIEQFVQ
jgi:hypothetical protein